MDIPPAEIRKTTEPIATPTLVQALRNHDAQIRQLAAEALGNKMQSDDIILAALLETMHDPHEEVRAAVISALEAIGLFGSKAQEVITALLDARHDPCERVRKAAEKAFRAVLEDCTGGNIN